MKLKITLLALLLITSMMSVQKISAQNFVHPGLPFTIGDLDRMEANRTISPWTESWDIIINSNQASLDYVMQGPAVDVENKGNDNIYISDVHAMLYHALQYYFTKDEAHAELAVSIIKPWVTTHKTWSGTSAHLGAAWRGGTMAQACEILRHTYPGWTAELTAQSEDYFQEVFWPLFRLPNPLRAANQGANNLMGAMYVAVYCNDQEKFDMCIEAYINDTCGGISNTLPNGQNGDTGRDQGHAMGMIGNLATVAEIAWAQGIDLYGVLDNRLLAVHEYWTKYNLGNEVPWIDFGTCYGYYTSIGADGRNPSTSDAIPVTELIYGAYLVRKGLTAPFVKEYHDNLPIDENTFLFHKDSSFITTNPSFSYQPHSEFEYSDVTDLTGEDIGTTGTGSSILNNGIWTIKGSGSDLYGPNDEDQFHYAYIPITGDGSFIAQITSMNATNSLGKAALVIKESISSDSKMAEVNGTSVAGSEFSSRGFDGADGDGKQTFDLSTIPTWVKIERRGEHITGYVGPDGISWTPIQATKFTMSDDYYIGLGVTSNASRSYCTSTFENVQSGTNNSLSNLSSAYSLIEAENYTAMFGVSTEATTDISGTTQVTSVDTGDWMEYQIDVPYSGTYSMEYRVANSSNGDITLSVTDNILEQVTFNSTGGNTSWTTVQSATPFYLSKGKQTFKVLANSNGLKVNWLRLLLECSDTPILPYVESFDVTGKSLGKRQTSEITLVPGNKVSLAPLTIDGGSWSWTGPNDFISTDREVLFENIENNKSGDYIVTYTNDCGQIANETFTINITDSFYIEAESYTTMQGITTEITEDISGNSNVTNINSGDWMEYQVDVPYKGIYSIDYRVASETNDIDFNLNVNGSFASEVNFVATGGSQVWTTETQNSTVYLEEGLQTLRILSNTNDWNINWLELTLVLSVDACVLPYNNEGFNVQNTSIEWATETINISCKEEVDILVKAESIGNLSTSDFLNVFYKIDSGEKVAVTNVLESDSNIYFYVENIKGNALELFIESKSSSSSDYYSISTISIYDGVNQFDKIEAENYTDVSNSNSETTKDTGGGYNMAGTKNDSYLMYANINLTGAENINIRFATRTSGGTLEVRIDSPTGELLGTVDLPGTGNWQTWTTVSRTLLSKVGFYDLYLIFKTDETGYVGNINWLQLDGTLLSTKNINIENALKIYPTPAHDIINIVLQQSIEINQVTIYNIQGQHLLSKKKSTIDISKLKPGIYMIEVNTNKGKTTKKIIVE